MITVAIGALAGGTIFGADVLESAGRWAVAYLVLSLSLALIWIALVTAGWLYGRRVAGNECGWAGQRPVSPRISLKSWQRETDDFWRQLQLTGWEGPGHAGLSPRRDHASTDSATQRAVGDGVAKP